MTPDNKHYIVRTWHREGIAPITAEFHTKEAAVTLFQDKVSCVRQGKYWQTRLEWCDKIISTYKQGDP